ncbi:probable translation initiation factor eIF-2B subunit delta isoform X2 [Beta vulgaris subsp. vulgaris]|uniref:probable translation initiation factor eIF-2B subunit delta isoform X2 n=1 Tax=Beta vulgaris subsp. vulgaris TaxID=3555 RepID=UPI0020374933|nr:probable translation initiation factor eIF-2B subunit delta isoform X2 [Beta vulgaris subsp. vulgaris]
MDPPRRNTRAVIDPKIRQVGFFAPDRTHSDSLSSSSSSSPVAGVSPSGNSLSPVMIPPPRHCSDTQILLTSSRPVGPHYPAVPSSPLRRPLSDVVTSHLVVGSYNPSDILPADSENSEDVVASPSGAGRGRKGGSKFASSLPSGGFNLMVGKAGRSGNGNGGVGGGSSSLISASGVKVATGVSAGEVSADAQSEPGNAKPTKEKLSKAERRALQEAQRAAKAAAKADMSKASTGASGGGTLGSSKQAKVRASAQSKDNASVAASEKKGGDRQSEKERKKDVPHPRMQFDDKTRVEKAKKRAVVKQTEARNRVELFRHLPQYEHGTQLPDLEAKFFQLEPMHPAVYKVGLRYLTGDISGGNARCIAMLEAFQDAIRDYSTPPEKVLVRDLTARIGSYVSFLIECRPLSISMGNAIRFLKNRIAKLSLSSSESEAKASLQSDINHFIGEKILIADKVIVKHAVTKIRDGDVLLTYGSSSAVELILLHAHEIGKQFRVVIVDSRPKLEGQLLLRRLVAKGLNCTYTHINAVSYSMHEVTRVFLGAASILSNGTVYSRVGTACVAMVAHAFHVPVLVCCEAYKFHERVQLDSICFNELGDPDAILKVPGRTEINYLSDWTSSENLQLLNLMYDTTPSDYISMIITDYGMIPPTSVPVIVREHRREHLWS